MSKKARKLYKIGEVIELLGITPRTLRYYEQFGLLRQIKRTKGNVRLFDDEDITLIKKIRKIQKEKSLSLQEIRETLFKKKDSKTSKSIVCTDSSITIPEHLLNTIDLEIVPFKILLGDQEQNDIINTSPDSLLEMNKKYVLNPIILVPTVQNFIDKYLELEKKGYKKVYSIHSSSKLFNTYDNACKAASKIADTIQVIPINSASTGPGLGVLVYQIAKIISQGASIEEIDLAIAKQKPLVDMFLMSNSLSHIISGGFIQKEEDKNQLKLSLDLINFKPVLSLRNKTGKTEIIQIFKYQDEAIEYLSASLENEIQSRGCHNGFVQQIGIYHNNMEKEAKKLLKILESQYGYANPFLCEGSYSLQLYFGTETIGIALI